MDGAHIERRVHVAVGEAWRSDGAAEAQRRLQLRFHRRHGGERGFLRRRNRRDVVVEMRNEDVPVVVAQARHQFGDHHRRARRPASVMAVVQRFRRPIDGGLKTRDAAIAEIDHLPAALMHGAVAHDQKIAMQQRQILGHDRRQMRRALLFFAFVKELDVDEGLMPAAFSASKPRARPESSLYRHRLSERRAASPDRAGRSKFASQPAWPREARCASMA